MSVLTLNNIEAMAACIVRFSKPIDHFITPAMNERANASARFAAGKDFPTPASHARRLHGRDRRWTRVHGDIAGEDVLGLVREGNACIDTATIQRFRRSRTSEWEMIARPGEGVAFRAGDLGVLSGELLRVGQMWDIAVPVGSGPAGPGLHKPGPGALPKYDWDRFAGALAAWIYNYGKPRSQRELVAPLLEWFQHTHGSVPDERTVEKKIQAMWVEITACEDEPVVFGVRARGRETRPGP